MLSVPPLIDQFGNINLHMEEDLVVPLQGGSGVGDLSTRTLSFRVPSRRISHTPIVNPADPTGRIIRLTSKDMISVRTGDRFILLDRTGGGSVARWEGTITRRD